MVISPLNQKLLRDLRRQWGQVLAIALVLACGVATFVMSVNMLGVLRRAQSTYYERYRFAEVFAHLKRGPESLVTQIAEIPGVAQVQTRIVMPAILDMPGVREPVSARLISIPDRSAPMLNDLFLRKGRTIDPGRSREVLVNESFAVAHGLEPGDSVRAILNGRIQELRIVGIALSPEYIYQLGPGQILPDDRLFGVFWMGHAEMAAVFDMKGAFNDIALTLTPDASEPEVLLRLDRLTERYGGLGAYSRADQQSHEFVTNELQELRGMAGVVPSIFLGVAAFLLNVVLARTIGTQREQIAALKAFGYYRWEIGLHYLQFVGLIVIVGILLGTIAGTWLGQRIAALYAKFFHFPVFEFTLDPSVVVLAAGIAGGAAILGTLSAVWKAIALPAAEAMKPEPPASYSRSLVERLRLNRILSPSVRMVFRLIERRRWKTLFTLIGISMAVAIVILGSFGKDAIDHVLEAQFSVAQRQHLSVSFLEPQAREALHDLEQLPGVTRVEPLRSVGVRIRNGNLSRRVGLLGIAPDATLNRVMDVHGQIVPLPPEGVVLSRKLAELLELRLGDRVMVEVFEKNQPKLELLVVGLVDDFAGTTAYMDIRAVNRALQEGPLASGAYLQADPAQTDALFRAIKRSPQITGITIQDNLRASYRRTIGENMLTMRLFNVIFAAIIAFGVIYNSARIALAERSHELATLRVLGFTRGEVTRMLLGELASLTLLAIPLGFLLGYGLAYMMIAVVFDTELFRLPLVLQDSTYGFAASITLLAALVSGWVVRARLHELDLVSALKNRE